MGEREPDADPNGNEGRRRDLWFSCCIPCAAPWNGVCGESCRFVVQGVPEHSEGCLVGSKQHDARDGSDKNVGGCLQGCDRCRQLVQGRASACRECAQGHRVACQSSSDARMARSVLAHERGYKGLDNRREVARRSPEVHVHEPGRLGDLGGNGACGCRRCALQKLGHGEGQGQ